jgi:hypothetical protein
MSYREGVASANRSFANRFELCTIRFRAPLGKLQVTEFEDFSGLRLFCRYCSSIDANAYTVRAQKVADHPENKTERVYRENSTNYFGRHFFIFLSS